MDNSIGQKMLLAFEGKDRLPPSLLDDVRKIRPAGFTLFRALNVDNPAQVRALTQSLQKTATLNGLPRFLIAADQEGGQLMAVGNGTTPLPGNLALGAAGSPELAFQAGEALGRELRAMGININFAPCCDVNVNPENPTVGTRSFGESPTDVAALSAAMTQGLQSVGIAATAKHFPGHGDTKVDSHHGVAVLPYPLERLRRVEFPPFQASIEAGARLVMAGHLALSALDGGHNQPATLSPHILQGLLRTELGFGGVIVSDAMDMRAIPQGEALGEMAVQAVAAGVDLILMGADRGDQSRAFSALVEAEADGRLAPAELSLSFGRIRALRDWISAQAAQPDLEVVGCAKHLALAGEIGARSVTLVRDHAGLLPLRLASEGKVAVILPRPADLTPADTSSYEAPGLAEAMLQYHQTVVEYNIPHTPSARDISGLIEEVGKYDLLVICSLNASSQPAQAEMVRAVLNTGIPAVVAALRMPYDLAAFPQAETYVCTYSIQEPSIQALADALWGHAPFLGRLPVAIPGLYPVGHGQQIVE